jgi:dihydroxyacetone kinase
LPAHFLHHSNYPKPDLSLIPADRVIFNSLHSPKKVSIISGGGAGHEPAWAGYVGHNMLAAAASGDIFASPSARQIESAIKAVPSEVGTILVITNYTGDCLHFGMASEKANASGYQKGPVAVITCGDDVSVGTKKGGLVGRRGLPGQVLGMGTIFICVVLTLCFFRENMYLSCYHFVEFILTSDTGNSSKSSLCCC